MFEKHLWKSDILSNWIFTKNVTLPQVFFKHLTGKNQLPGFYISGTLVENWLDFRVNKENMNINLCCYIWEIYNTLFVKIGKIWFLKLFTSLSNSSNLWDFKYPYLSFNSHSRLFDKQKECWIVMVFWCLQNNSIRCQNDSQH